MITTLETYQPAPLKDLSHDQLHANIDLVLNGHLPGFVIAASMADGFPLSIAYAYELGLEGEVNSTTMAFDYDNTSANLTPDDTPGPDDWKGLGITPLHADGTKGDHRLSINQAIAGAYDIMLFDRGPKVADDMPSELWDSLQDENMGVLLKGKVDPEMLSIRAMRLAISAGQTAVFNPSHPHMGVTRVAPRRSNATFFSTPA
jgi:hypothetical protein